MTHTDTDRTSVVGTVRDLIAAAQVDTLYRDLFLQRAIDKLRGIFPEAAYRDALELDPRIGLLLAENRVAVDRQDWTKVKSLSTQVTQLRKELQERVGEMELGAQVYEAAPVAVDPLCIELQPLLAEQMSVAAARTAALASFERLGAGDAKWAELYSRRRAFFDELQAPAATGDVPVEKRGASVAQLRQEAQSAAAAGDVTRLEMLAQAILDAEAAGAPAASATPAAGASPALRLPPEIQQSFAASAVERARALGFAHVETKPESQATATAIQEFLRQHQWRTPAAATAIAKEGAVRMNDLMREIAVPSDMTGPTSTVILMFAIHPFVSSGGIRYVVHFGTEYALVEDFPETAEPPADAALLQALGLKRRRGLARLEIEQALREHGPAVVQEQLGLDPRDYRLVCIPWDVYLRVGRDLGWGQQPWWTHVDGYQLVRGGRLRALVAGDVRHGGLLDLCAIAADDAREGVLARFAVVRRARMLIGRT